MTEDPPVDGASEPVDEPRPWWFGGVEGLPDVESLLGPEGMEAVGGVAEEALKLFVVLRDRAGAAGVGPTAAAALSSGGQAGGWGTVLGNLAAGAVNAVSEFAAAQQATPTSGQGGAQSAPSNAPGLAHGAVAPGQAAACSYCPVCQLIAVFRSVPMSTWQRLATSVVEAADAARDFASAAGSAPHVVVTPDPRPSSGGPVAQFLDGLEHPNR